jgi:hypothetical protein
MIPVTKKCLIFLLFQRQTTESFCGRKHTLDVIQPDVSKRFKIVSLKKTATVSRMVQSMIATFDMSWL